LNGANGSAGTDQELIKPNTTTARNCDEDIVAIRMAHDFISKGSGELRGDLGVDRTPIPRAVMLSCHSDGPRLPAAAPSDLVAIRIVVMIMRSFVL